MAREHSDGVDVVRTWLLPFPNRKAYERMLNYSSFCVSAASTGLFLSRPDVVIATSPQLLVALSGWWLARCKRVLSFSKCAISGLSLWPRSASVRKIPFCTAPCQRLQDFFIGSAIGLWSLRLPSKIIW